MLGSIGWYIFRTTFGAFLIILFSLTSVIWLTHALRDIDLMTNQGQTVLVFIGITGLIIPQLVLIIAPVALMIAMAHTLNKLANDSEIIVMNAAGMSPWRLFHAFLAAAVVVSALVAVLAAVISPKCIRELRRWAAEVRADLVTNIVQPGRFTTIESGLTFHIRERQPNGVLLGIFIDDLRDPTERATFLAEQGQIMKSDKGTFLVLQRGSVQRHPSTEPDPTIVIFDRYAFDLSQFTSSAQGGGAQELGYSPSERYEWELMSPDPKDPIYVKDPGQFPAELHDRLAAPLYPLAFMVITYAYLGAPRTTRQSRNMSLISAVAAISALRFTGFASMVFGVKSPPALALQYIALAAAFILGLRAISRGTIIEPPAFITNAVAILTERLSRRFASSSS
jgi:lipopolysaccharide export system permease protein